MKEDRAPLIVFERTQWILTGVHAHAIGYPVGSRGGILKVVSPISLGHPGSFDPAHRAVLVPVPVALPDMRRLKLEEVLLGAQNLRQVVGVKFYTVHSPEASSGIIEVDPVIVVDKERRVEEAPALAFLRVRKIAHVLEWPERILAPEKPDGVSAEVHVVFIRESARGIAQVATVSGDHLVICPVHQVIGLPCVPARQIQVVFALKLDDRRICESPGVFHDERVNVTRRLPGLGIGRTVPAALNHLRLNRGGCQQRQYNSRYRFSNAHEPPLHS